MPLEVASEVEAVSMGTVPTQELVEQTTTEVVLETKPQTEEVPATSEITVDIQEAEMIKPIESQTETQMVTITTEMYQDSQVLPQQEEAITSEITTDVSQAVLEVPMEAQTEMQTVTLVTDIFKETPQEPQEEAQTSDIIIDVEKATVVQPKESQVEIVVQQIEAQPEKFTTEVIQEQVTDVEGMQVVGSEITFDVSQATVVQPQETRVQEEGERLSPDVFEDAPEFVTEEGVPQEISPETTQAEVVQIMVQAEEIPADDTDKVTPMETETDTAVAQLTQIKDSVVTRQVTELTTEVVTEQRTQIQEETFDISEPVEEMPLEETGKVSPLKDDRVSPTEITVEVGSAEIRSPESVVAKQTTEMTMEIVTEATTQVKDETIPERIEKMEIEIPEQVSPVEEDKVSPTEVHIEVGQAEMATETVLSKQITEITTDLGF